MSSEAAVSSSTVENCALPDGEDFEPSAEELESFYVMLESGVIPELSWTCPGRRHPEAVAKVEQSTPADSTETQEPVKNDFDFSDDVAPTQMRVRNLNSTPKSSKKKMANFAGVMEVLQKKKNAEGGAPT